MMACFPAWKSALPQKLRLTVARPVAQAQRRIHSIPESPDILTMKW